MMSLMNRQISLMKFHYEKEFKAIYTVKKIFCIVLSIVVAQTISFLDILKSNTQLAHTIYNLNQAGYSIVPTGKVLASLNDIFPAFAGALFISLTAGITIALTSTILMFICKNIFRSYLVCFLIWGSISLYIFIIGETLFTVAYTLCIPGFIFLFLEVLMKRRRQKILSEHLNIKSNQSLTHIRSFRHIYLILTISLLITTVFYYNNCDRGIFLRLRDYLILSCKVGTRLNDFYYRYTLYAAEAIKPPSQKQLKTLDNDNHGFFTNPFSQQQDHHRVMRFLCFAGLILFLPIFLYASAFLLIFYLVHLCCLCCISFISKSRGVLISGTISGIICVGASILLLYFIYPLNWAEYSPIREKQIELKNMLGHPDYRIRIEGLKIVCTKQKFYTKEHSKNINNKSADIWNFPETISSAMTGKAAERYWLANAFGSARKQSALPYLEILSADPSINVQCAAIRAIGEILAVKSNYGAEFYVENKIICFLQNKISQSSEWYVQKSAYNVLKKLGKSKLNKGYQVLKLSINLRVIPQLFFDDSLFGAAIHNSYCSESM